MERTILILAPQYEPNIINVASNCILALGCVLTHYNTIQTNSSEILTRFTFLVAMPCELFMSFSQTPIELNF